MSITLTPEQEAQARQLAEQLKQQAVDPFLAIARLLVATDESTLFGATEFAVRKHALELISKAYSLHLGQKKNGYRGASIACPKCGQAASFHAYRGRDPQCLGGVIRCQRAYYYCRRCGKGFAPWDESTGLSERNLTPGLEQIVCLTGAVADSFDKGADLLEKTAGVRLSESTVQRTTESAGERIAAHLGAGKTFGARVHWNWYRDACGRRVAYLGRWVRCYAVRRLKSAWTRPMCGLP